MGPLETGSNIKEKEIPESDHGISMPRRRSCREYDRGVPTRSSRFGIKYLTRARSRCDTPCNTRRSSLKAMRRKDTQSASDPNQPRVRPMAVNEIEGVKQEKKLQDTLPRDHNTAQTHSGSEQKDYVNRQHGSKSCVDFHENNDIKTEELGQGNIDSRSNEVKNSFKQLIDPIINNHTRREAPGKSEVKTQNTSDSEADEEKTIYIRHRTPSISPVLRTSSASEDSRLSPFKGLTENPYRTTSDSQTKRSHSNFSISAILGRVSSTPKKEMPVSSLDTRHSSKPAQDSVYSTHVQDSLYSTHVQDSVYSTHVTSSQLNAGRRNRKVESGSEENMRNAANAERSSSSCSSCGSCQHSTTEVARKKMERTKFPKEHIQILTESFWKEPYPSSLEIEKLAEQLGHRSLQIKTWFQNKRASVSGTRRPKGQTPTSSLTFQPDVKAPAALLFPVPHSMITNFIHRHQSVPRISSQGGSFVTPSNTFASLTGHAYPMTANSYIVPTPAMGSVTSNSYIVPHPPLGSVASTHFPPYSSLPSFHYFGSGF